MRYHFSYIYSMGFTKLTEEYLPGFIHVVDRITEEEYDLDYKEIAERENKKGEIVVGRSIGRAFDLRRKLVEGWEGNKQKPVRPQKKTLDVLVAFLENNSKLSFLEYCIEYKAEIEAHFVLNKPDQEWVDALFGKRKGKVNEKISAMEDKREELMYVLENYSLEELKQVLGPRAKQQLTLLLEEWKSDELEPFFESILEQRIKKLENKITASKRLQRRLGILSLLFLPQDDELTFEEDIFSAIEKYQVDISNDSEMEEPLLDLISKLSSQ